MTTKTLAPSLIALGLAAALGGCQDRDFGMSITHVVPLTTDCTLGTSSFLASGVVDIALRDNYTLFPSITNNLGNINEIKQFDETDGRVDTSNIVLRSATIEYTTLETLSAEIQSPTVVPLSGTIPAGSSLTIGVEALNSGILSQLRDADEFLLIDESGTARPIRSTIKIIARMRIEGETLDGKDVESSEFLFPIEICNGCRITYDAPLLVQSGGVATCPPVTRDAEGNVVVRESDEGLCLDTAGADNGFVDCQQCQGLAVNGFARQLCQPPVD